ncbi:MAG TPA: adenylate/guanylate cyclase domain-containing protein [Burkholderiales bacterium]|nr:adenylate/guanylate cyclase domain-containing protein [Burkholderiales bacterium]
MAAARALGLVAIAVVLAAAAELFTLHALQPVENRVLDRFARSHAAALPPDPDIVLVDIDEKSLAAMEPVAGRWPWPRVVHAELIEGLAAQKPRAIVFDIMFAEADRFRPQDDAAFAETVAQHPNTYFPLLRLPAAGDRNGVRLAELGPLGLVRTKDADAEARMAIVPPMVLPPAHWRAGLITFLEDADGVGRRYLLREVVRGWHVPSLPARLAFDLGFPVPDRDDLVLAWRGRAREFTRVSYSDLYDDFNRSARQRPAAEFTGKIVIVGTAATGLQDLRVTPIDSLHPGAEILGTAIENLKNARSMRPAHGAWPAAAGLALLVLLFAGFHARLDVRLIGGGLALASAGLVYASYAAAGRLVLLPMVTPLAAAWTFYAAAALADYLRERRSRLEAVSLFSRFVNPHVVKQLIERGGIEGAGQTREVTLLFSDIRGFTTLSETRRPEEVVAILNRYFSLQVDVVFSHGGSLDKFIGDCIMALWGAPLDDGDHARHAVACALDMADTLQAFKRELGAEATDFDVGIGLHSGPAVVGLIGSERRREYTAIGDTVNLASRIEGLTKEAKRRILVSKDTMERCGDAFDFVSCGSYAVKGRTQPVELFEPRRKS